MPEALKTADVSRFATRAAQIEKAKPTIAYWAYYWIVQQIVTKGLHKANEECMNYTIHLMDKLEEVSLCCSRNYEANNARLKLRMTML